MVTFSLFGTLWYVTLINFEIGKFCNKIQNMIGIFNSYKSNNINKNQEKILFNYIYDVLNDMTITINKSYKFNNDDLKDIINELMINIVERRLPPQRVVLDSEADLKRYLYVCTLNYFKQKSEKDKKNKYKQKDFFETLRNNVDYPYNSEAEIGYKEYLIPRLNKLKKATKFNKCFTLIIRYIRDSEMSYRKLKLLWPADYGQKSEGALRKGYSDCKKKIITALLN